MAVDVQYENDGAFAAGVVFNEWSADSPERTCVCKIPAVEEYVPGQFYKRELPCILQLLNDHQLTPTYILIDGYVYLDGHSTPGLGKHLSDALHGNVKIIGVAKTPFSKIGPEFEILRGGSKKPLYVTSIGEELSAAKAKIVSMHGQYRIPTLLKKVDQASRQIR